MTVQIVVPVYNEAATVAAVVRAARAHAPVLVVDDGSTDASGDAARAAGAEVLRHEHRRGKAAALRTGIAAARESGATVVVTLDGDGQHDVGDLPRVLAAADAATLVVGGRLAGGAWLPTGRLNAIRVAGFFVNWVSGLRVMDTQSGFRAYPAALFDDVHPRRGGFVFETEVLIAAAAGGWRVVEIPVTPIPRAARRSRFRPAIDGAAIAAYLAGCVMRRWGAETAAAAGAVGGIFRRDRLRARHAAILEAASAYDPVTPLWGAVMTTTAARRAIARVSGWWRHPRRRRAATAAAASAATPVLLALVVLRAVGGRLMPDLVSPLVRRLYAQERLAFSGETPAAAPPADAAPLNSEVEVTW